MNAFINTIKLFLSIPIGLLDFCGLQGGTVKAVELARVRSGRNLLARRLMLGRLVGPAQRRHRLNTRFNRNKIICAQIISGRSKILFL